MSKWDELEKAAREADGAVARNINTATEKWQHFRLIAKPDAVLTLIEQNKRMRSALKRLRGFTVSPTEIEIIDEAMEQKA